MPYFYFDPTYILIIVAYVITLWAQIKVKAAYSKYSKVPNRAGIDGAGAARLVLNSNGVYDVSIGAIAGEMTDHYDPRDNSISLSTGVVGTASVAAVGIAAHEAGHALQYARGYAPIKLRSAMVPVCNVASNLAWPIFFIGLILNAYGNSGTLLMEIGIFAFCFAVIFQAVTFPVELNASRRAMRALRASGNFTEEELVGAKKVLTAAALTYFAALAGSLLQLFRLLLIASSNSKRNGR